jgi:hypothetical protein
VTAGEGPDPRPALAVGQLPPAYERWRLTLAPGEARPSDAALWAGAIVLVASGEIEVECLTGGCRRFVAGDLVALGWLPLRSLRNRGRLPVELVAVRRIAGRPVRSAR